MGATLGSSGKRLSPGLLDLVLVLLLWTGAFMTRSALGKWPAILVWLSIGLLVGLALIWLRKRTLANEKEAAPIMAGGWQALWERWLGFSKKFGDFQSRVLLAFLYFIVVLPFGLGLQILSDPLKTRKEQPDSLWEPWELTPKTIDEARRQG